MKTIICRHSGLSFEVEDKSRKVVHPDIACLLKHWYKQGLVDLAAKVIAQGKVQGWTTVKQFKDAIELAHQELWEQIRANSCEPRPVLEHNISASWLARITGWDRNKRLRYDREFIQPVGSVDGINIYLTKDLPDGLYESGRKVRREKSSYQYFTVVSGVASSISEDEIELILGERPESRTTKGTQS